MDSEITSAAAEFTGVSLLDETNFNWTEQTTFNSYPEDTPLGYLQSFDDETIEEEQTLDEPSVKIKVQTIWTKIIEEFSDERYEIEKYKKSIGTECVISESAIESYMKTKLFSLLCSVMEDTFAKAIEKESLKYQKSPFNGLDYIAEQLWNRNPLYPERLEKNLFIHDMDWAIEYLKKHPRPFFPLSWIFTKDIAATKIQAYMRGYWVRRRENVQEMRQFWRELKREKQENPIN